MALINTLKTDTFDAWRIKTNTTASELGDNALLIANPTLSSSNSVDAILEVLIKAETEIGVIGALTTTAQSLVGGINEHDAEIGVLSTLTTTQKGTIVGSINELDLDIGAPSALTTTAKNNIVSAINELDAEHGVLSTLTTTAKGTFVSSINEIVARETSRYDNTVKLDLTHSSVGGSNNSTQNILSNMSLPAGKTFDILGTLNISNGSLIVGGANGSLNINTTFLGLGDVNSPDAPSGGIIINRGTDGSNQRPDVRIYWDKTDNKWHLKRLDAGGSSITPYILDDINFSDIITSGSQAGIAVTYDQATNKLDFDVNDFAITLTGDVSGTATVTNLGNVSIATTVQPNMVALGTDTTGAYIKTISLDVTPGIPAGISFSAASGAGGESTDLSALKVDSTVARTFGVQSISGIKTFVDKPIYSSGITTNAISTLHSATVTNDLTIQGNLIVTGTTTTVNAETVTIADNIIVLNSNSAATPTEDAGFEVERGNLINSSVLWDEAADDWKMYNGTASYYLVGTLISGNTGVTVSQDSTEKAQWTISHSDTSSQASVDNSNGNVIQDITLDTYGHVTALGSYDLDNRYFTETEADARFVNVTGDTMTGILTNSAGFVGPLSGNASTASSAAKLTTARTITLAGDATGSVSFDGASNVSLTVAVVDDSHNHVIGNIDNFVENVQDVVGGMFDPVNIENGISLYYDDASGKINADVGDFTITLSGAVTGSGTVNNLGNVSISTSGSGSDLNDIIDARMPRIYNVSGTQVFP
tara:strand:- start:1065 stop:3359 length:2295 start_codon:yes stop_codon:yes gene_type:complete